MSRVIYLVAADEAAGVKDANGRGWRRIAMWRFVTPDKDDVRVVCRINDLIPLAGRTPMIKGLDYESGPAGKMEFARWAGDDGQAGEKAAFDRFVFEGNGEWIDV